MQVVGDNVSTKRSAGLLLFRQSDGGLEVLLAHPGGPYWRRKDDGAWTIPKGEAGAGEADVAAARREFAEEIGYDPPGDCLPLGAARQPGGKSVVIFAVRGEWQPQHLLSNLFELEWPPRSGQLQSFPEVDRAAWFSIGEARRKILKGQLVFLDRLVETLR
jgi:predicted NUDIX family NTP pyrophosphohydrolase